MVDRPEKRLGLGAMIQELFGNEVSVEVFTAALNKEVTSLALDNELNDGDGALVFGFEDGSKMGLVDAARSCCESRYLDTDDDLSYYTGAQLIGVEVREGLTTTYSKYGDKHETAFLIVKTSKGEFTVCCHNRHNGYYGGICIQAVDLRKEG